MKRIVLKLSGEMLGDSEYNFSKQNLNSIISNIIYAYKNSLEVIIVCGGGNIIRGKDMNIPGINQVTSHQMGMIATIINALALRDLLKNHNHKVEVFSAYETDACLKYEVHRASEALKDGVIVIIAGGTGRAHATTDTAAVLAAVELEADIVVKATKVPGVYDKDPLHHQDVTFSPTITYQDALIKGLNFIDWQALGLAKEKNMKIIVGKLEKKEDSLLNLIKGDIPRSIIN